MSKEAVDTMLGLKLAHLGINSANEEEAMATAQLLGSLLNMGVAPGNSSIFVGKKEFEIMKKPGRGKNGHIAIACNNVDRAIYHLSRRGVKFDLDSKNVRTARPSPATWPTRWAASRSIWSRRKLGVYISLFLKYPAAALAAAGCLDECLNRT